MARHQYESCLNRAGLNKCSGTPMSDVMFSLMLWLWLQKESIGLFAGFSLNLKQRQPKEHQRDLFFAKTVSIFEPLKLMPLNLRCPPYRVVSSAYRQDKIAFTSRFCHARANRKIVLGVTEVVHLVLMICTYSNPFN
jgi:hypothetical protein